MTRRRHDAPRRTEITEEVEKHTRDLEEKAGEIEQTVADVNTERDTLAELELAGSAETAEAVEQAIEGAQDASTQEFDTQNGELEGLQGETQDQETDLHERSDTTAADLGKLSDASGRIHSDTANSRLLAAKESALRDIEFLNDQERQGREAREQSQRLQAERQRQVRAERRS